MTNGWHREWVGKVRDLEKIEANDLQPMVRENCAWLVKDSRRDLRSLLVETLTDEMVQPAVYVREYVIFLESGLWWRVPTVRVRCVYDRRGIGKGKLDISHADFNALYVTYFPHGRREHTIVEGLEPHLHRVRVSV